MLLLGAGSHYRPEMPGTPGAILWLTLFRDKIDDIMEQVKCPVAVFVNRGYREGALVSFVLGGMIDIFLLSYISIMLQKRSFGASFSFLIRTMRSSVGA